MAKRGKKYLEALKLVDRTKHYEVNEAIELVLKTAVKNFDETIEVAVRLGVDPRHADQQVKGYSCSSSRNRKKCKSAGLCKRRQSCRG